MHDAALQHHRPERRECLRRFHCASTLRARKRQTASKVLARHPLIKGPALMSNHALHGGMRHSRRAHRVISATRGRKARGLCIARPLCATCCSPRRAGRIPSFYLPPGILKERIKETRPCPAKLVMMGGHLHDSAVRGSSRTSRDHVIWHAHRYSRKTVRTPGRTRLLPRLPSWNRPLRRITRRVRVVYGESQQDTLHFAVWLVRVRFPYGDMRWPPLYVNACTSSISRTNAGRLRSARWRPWASQATYDHAVDVDVHSGIRKSGGDQTAGKTRRQPPVINIVAGSLL